MAKFIMGRVILKQAEEWQNPLLAVLDFTNILFGWVSASCYPQTQVADGIRFPIRVQKYPAVSCWNGQV